MEKAVPGKEEAAPPLEEAAPGKEKAAPGKEGTAPGKAGRSYPAGHLGANMVTEKPAGSAGVRVLAVV